jgi:hypothetical protein
MVYRRRWIVAALTVGALVVLSAPIALLWNWLRPEPWDARHLRVHFESVRYERAGLVFTYRLENRTRRAARLLPGQTTIRAMQPGGEPLVGYPVVRLPLDIEAHETQSIELRLELATPEETKLTPRQSEEQTARVLRHKLPDVSDLDSPLSPLPMSPGAAPAAPPAPAESGLAAELVANALGSLNGFEVEDASHGIRIVFPRGW